MTGRSILSARGSRKQRVAMRFPLSSLPTREGSLSAPSPWWKPTWLPVEISHRGCLPYGSMLPIAEQV